MASGGDCANCQLHSFGGVLTIVEVRYQDPTSLVRPGNSRGHCCDLVAHFLGRCRTAFLLDQLPIGRSAERVVPSPPYRR